MVVGVCRITLQLEDCLTDKDKRSVLRRIKDRVQKKWNCAMAEVGDSESLQTAHLGFAVVANESGYTRSLVHKILQFVDDLAFARITDDEQDYLDYGNASISDLADGNPDHFEPDEPTPPYKAPTLRSPTPLAPVEYPWDSPTHAAKSPATASAHHDRKPREEPPSEQSRGQPPAKSLKSTR